MECRGWPQRKISRAPRCTQVQRGAGSVPIEAHGDAEVSDVLDKTSAELWYVIIIWSGCPRNGTSGPVDFRSCLGQPFEARNNRMSCIREIAEKRGVACGCSRVLVIMNSILES
jgi:hypothetical protein